MKTLTIGIPIFNEERNIKNLLNQILKQKLNNCKLVQIIISSDGSTDNSVKTIEDLKLRIVEVVVNAKRSGIHRGLNQIFKMSNTDFLVTLDADVNIVDKYFLQKLIEPLVDDSADLTTSSIDSYDNKNYFQKSLKFSMDIKKVIFSSFNGGQNIYTCYGLARGYSKKVYKKLFFPFSYGNDMYTYLWCKKNKMKFKNVFEATVYYKLPSNLKDHAKQSSRFYNSLDIQRKYFDKNIIQREINIPLIVLVTSFPKIFIKLILNPNKASLYFLVHTYVFITQKQEMHDNKWEISSSTK